MNIKTYILNTIGLLIIVLLSACGGGGPNDFNQNGNNKTAIKQEASAVVLIMNRPLQRTPAGFYNLNQKEAVEHDYFHVRSDHINPATNIRSELSTADPQQAFVWSQQAVMAKTPNALFISSNETAWYYENTWRLNDPAIVKPRLLSARVFKSDTIDRTVYDANNPTPLLAVIQRRPLTQADARFISEYLWTFSSNNNAGHVIIDSRSENTLTGIRHTLREAIFNPVMSDTACATVQIWNLHYDIDSISGGITLSRSIQREFHAKEDDKGRYVFCQEMRVQTLTTEQGNLAVYPKN